MLSMGGGMRYLLMILAAAAASKWADDEEAEHCNCLQYSPINPYAFIRKDILMSSFSDVNKMKRQHDEVPTTTQPDRKKEKKDEDVPSMKME
ncbi:hypothetical protein KGM_203001 [Danaus plexippus plexippus]|uniref:Uncharacterized protein n=1 Tax=Danaus plexippus plexippus TaxID=278856 RepID=A0A212EKI9_DANPL|nr:hypothetical protein KGM_203001 [Danaus plexippus plexippus]